jgi:tetratricopeptide (TPR) repeat protein
MRLLLLFGTIFTASFLLFGCSNPINAVTAQRYYDAGEVAEQRNDLPLAQKNYWNAYGNARWGNLGPSAEAYPLYEFARVSGYMGDHAAAATNFAKVLELIDQANGDADTLRAPTLTEYARLLHDTDQHEKAVDVFQAAIIELSAMGILEEDPLGFALFLEDYAASLRETNRSEEADEVEARVEAIRSEHPDEKPLFVPRRYKS